MTVAVRGQRHAEATKIVPGSMKNLRGFLLLAERPGEDLAGGVVNRAVEAREGPVVGTSGGGRPPIWDACPHLSVTTPYGSVTASRTSWPGQSHRPPRQFDFVILTALDSSGIHQLNLGADGTGAAMPNAKSHRRHRSRFASVARQLAEALGKWMMGQPWIMAHLHLLPPLPTDRLRRGYAPPLGSWPVTQVRVPTRLLTVPGIRRDREAEQVAFAAQPLIEVFRKWPKAVRENKRKNWDAFLPIWGARTAAEMKALATTDVRPVQPQSPPDPVTLTRGLKQRAGDIGLNAIGVAAYDPKYTFAEYLSRCEDAGNRVIVCLVEINYEAIQSIPSAHAERSVQASSLAAIDLAAELTYYLHRHGFRAAALRPDRFLLIPYAVEAGLGQLGRNGQLLTPFAGSRLRMTAIQTNAPLICDSPVDYGIPGLCDTCMVCVNRCPPSAIPNRRAMYRGVEKAKINIARCYPVIINAHGCAVCTKVCPVQRYGLQPVLDEFARTGRIIGKGTDDLEGYDWIDGQNYGPGRRPKFDKAIFQGYGFDAPVDIAPKDDESLQDPM